MIRGVMNTQQTSTVFVIDDDDLARESVQALAASLGLAAESFASAEDFLTGYAGDRPGCIVTDLKMPGLSGLDLQDRLRARGIELPLILVTGFANVPIAVRAMHRGAVTVLEKPCNTEELAAAIREALARDAEQRVRREQRQRIIERHQTLSPGEREVLVRMIAGEPNKQIAAELGVSMRTVEFRRHNIFKKMQTDSLAELVRIMVEAGLSPPVSEAPG